jgi:hypothetical protein
MRFLGAGLGGRKRLVVGEALPQAMVKPLGRIRQPAAQQALHRLEQQLSGQAVIRWRSHQVVLGIAGPLVLVQERHSLDHTQDLREAPTQFHPLAVQQLGQSLGIRELPETQSSAERLSTCSTRPVPLVVENSEPVWAP